MEMTQKIQTRGTACCMHQLSLLAGSSGISRLVSLNANAPTQSCAGALTPHDRDGQANRATESCFTSHTETSVMF